MPQSTTWRRIRVRNGGQIIEMLPAVADAMVNGGTAQYVDERGVPTDFYGKPLGKPVVDTATVNRGSERAAHTGKPQERPRR